MSDTVDWEYRTNARTMMWFEVRNVLLTGSGAALTLRPEQWFTDHPTELVSAGNELLAKLVPGSPFVPGAEPVDVGDGKMTELRFDHDPGIRPGDHIQVDIRVLDKVQSSA